MPLTASNFIDLAEKGTEARSQRGGQNGGLKGWLQREASQSDPQHDAGRKVGPTETLCTELGQGTWPFSDAPSATLRQRRSVSDAPSSSAPAAFAGFFNGLHFHRVIPKFMVQTGERQSSVSSGEERGGVPRAWPCHARREAVLCLPTLVCARKTRQHKVAVYTQLHTNRVAAWLQPLAKLVSARESRHADLSLASARRLSLLPRPDGRSPRHRRARAPQYLCESGSQNTSEESQPRKNRCHGMNPHHEGISARRISTSGESSPRNVSPPRRNLR